MGLYVNGQWDDYEYEIISCDFKMLLFVLMYATISISFYYYHCHCFTICTFIRIHRMCKFHVDYMYVCNGDIMYEHECV